jgi:hypothetical protein
LKRGLVVAIHRIAVTLPATAAVEDAGGNVPREMRGFEAAGSRVSLAIVGVEAA